MALPNIVGGGFKDSGGNVIAYGVLTVQLSGPATDTATGLIQICQGEVCSYTLDQNGNIPGSQYIWATDLLTPSTLYYKAIVYAADGQLAWGPNCQPFIQSGGAFVNLTTLVPSNPS
jgi:hypothetical protein